VYLLNTVAPISEPKPTLLIVDDDQELCAMLDEYLTLEGFAAVTAGTGPEGLELLVRSAWTL
jgi:two-component system response regulator CpxR